MYLTPIVNSLFLSPTSMVKFDPHKLFFYIKVAVHLYCLCEWSHLSSLHNENKPLVIWWYTRNQQWYEVKNSIKWTTVKSLSVALFIIYVLYIEHLWRYIYECISNSGPFATCVQTFHFNHSILLFYHIQPLLTNQYWRCMPRKTSLKLVHYCTLLSMACHFDTHNHNNSGHIL